MPKPSEIPTWADLGTTVTPTTGQRDQGWLAGDKPPAQWLNWWMNRVGKWCTYLNGLTGEVLTWTQQQTFSGGASVSGLTATTATTSGMLTANGGLTVANGGTFDTLTVNTTHTVAPGATWNLNANTLKRAGATKGQVLVATGADTLGFTRATVEDAVTYSLPGPVLTGDITLRRTPGPFVTMSGFINKSSAVFPFGSIFGTLPAGYRPLDNVIVPFWYGSARGSLSMVRLFPVRILTSGAMSIYPNEADSSYDTSTSGGSLNIYASTFLAAWCWTGIPPHTVMGRITGATPGRTGQIPYWEQSQTTGSQVVHAGSQNRTVGQVPFAPLFEQSWKNG